MIAHVGLRHMKTYIALLRGINVVGKGLLPMKELVAILESLGSQNVKTYIQSGNAVFRHKAGPAETPRLVRKISDAILASRAFAPHVLLLDVKGLSKAAAANPFPGAQVEPKSLHLFFLDSAPSKAKLKSLAALQSANEHCELRGSVFYLHAPDGIGRSKLAANVERRLGVTATSRNWRTVCKLLEIANEYA